MLQDFCQKIAELSKQVQILNDKIKNFASQQNREENKDGTEMVEASITQYDLLNDHDSGIIQRTCILHLELLLYDEFVNKLINQNKQFSQDVL